MMGLLVLLAACGDEAISISPGPLMRPGENCLRCHSEYGEAAQRPWSAGGTVFPDLASNRADGLEGVTVILRDANGKEVRLVTNAAGNFHTSEPLVGPLRPSLEYRGKRIDMPSDAPAGSCNACHSFPATGGTRGRIYAPK